MIVKARSQNLSMERRNSVGMQRKFKPAHSELDKLENKIFKTRGFIITWHVYSIEDLLQSTHHQKLYAITAQTGTDISNWNEAGNLSSEEREAYFRERETLEARLLELNQAIAEREPTWWESVKEIFVDFNFMLISNLPIVKANKFPFMLDTFLLPFKKMAKIVGAKKKK